MIAEPIDHAQPLSQDYVVIKEIPDSFHDQVVLTDAPSLVRLADGALLCAFPLLVRPKHSGSYRGSAGLGASLQTTYGGLSDKTLRVFVSLDDGTSWHEICEPLPFAAGRLFVHEETAFFLGVGPQREGIRIASSDDGGKRWCEAETLFKGLFYGTATGMAERAGTLYWAFGAPNADDLFNSAGSRSVAVAADLNSDLMDPHNWRISPYLAYPGTPDGLSRIKHDKDHFLEPNVVNVRGKIRAFLRSRINHYDTPNMAVVCDVGDDGVALTYRFTQFHPFPGGQNQFHIIYDDESRLFWMTSNIPAMTQDEEYAGKLESRGFKGKPGNERRFLMLFYSLDALNWFQACCIARWLSPLRAFNYTTPLIDAEDLLIVSRTSKNGRNQHDNDLVTFHRLPRFRSLALDLHPKY